MPTIRTMRDSDINRALELCRLANFNQIDEDWRYFLKHAQVFAAELEGQVVGTCAVLDPQGPTAWIAMMLVDPAVRRRSIGTRLFEHVLSVTTAESIGLDATALGKPLYEKYGFVPTAEIIRHKADILTLEPMPPYGLAPWRRGHSSNQIGPLQSARHAQAIAETQNVIAVNAGYNWIIDVPSTAPAPWRTWLQDSGFAPQRPLIRMFRGPARAIPSTLYATAGPEYGFHFRYEPGSGRL